nr:DNRLRE domain-containing protein [Paenibacillus xylanexedens]
MRSSFSVVYATQSELHASIQASPVSDLVSLFYVRDHNRAQGKYELLEAPRITMNLQPVADATTRSQLRLRTINFGDTQRMMIGQDELEQFESFIHFGDIGARIPDLMFLEEAKLKLYYTGTITPGASIELHQPDTLWREYGITYANKPHSIQRLTSSYSINKNERYVEFDMMDILKMLRNGELQNIGMMIQSNDLSPIYFNTRESAKPPMLQIKYITSQIYSIGRTEKESELFVYGVGHKELKTTLFVHSDIGFAWLQSNLYVHRYEDHIHHEAPGIVAVSRPDLNVYMSVAQGKETDLDSILSVIESAVNEQEAAMYVSKPEVQVKLTVSINTETERNVELAVRRSTEDEKVAEIAVSHPDLSSVITIDPKMSLVSELEVRRSTEDEKVAEIAVSHPDLSSVITIDPKMSLVSELSVRRSGDDERVAKLTVSHPDLPSTITIDPKMSLISELTVSRPFYADLLNVLHISKPELPSVVEVSNYTKARKTMDSELTVIRSAEGAMVSKFAVSRPDLGGMLWTRVPKDEEKLGIIEIPSVEEMISHLMVSRPDVLSSLEVKYTNDLEALIGVKEREYLECFVEVREWKDLRSMVDVRQATHLRSEMTISKPELNAQIQPRVIADKDMNAIANIRKRDASDRVTTLTLIVKGPRNQAYFYIL